MTGSDRAALARPVEPPSGPNLTGRASLNAVASFLEYGVRALVELVVSPLLVSGLGAAMYGAWRVLWQWSGYVWGASGRSAQALQFAIANRQWTATNQQKRELLGAAFVVWLLFVPILLAAGVLGVWLAPILLDVPADQVTPLRVAAAVLVLDALAVTVVTLPRSTLQGQNLGYARMTATPVMVAIGGGLVVLAVKLRVGPAGGGSRHSDHDVAHRRRVPEDHPAETPLVRDVPPLAVDGALVPPVVPVVPRLEVRPRANHRERRAGARALRPVGHGGRLRPDEVRLRLPGPGAVPARPGHHPRHRRSRRGRPDHARRRPPGRGTGARVGRRDRGRGRGGGVERDLHRALGRSGPVRRRGRDPRPGRAGLADRLDPHRHLPDRRGSRSSRQGRRRLGLGGGLDRTGRRRDRPARPRSRGDVRGPRPRTLDPRRGGPAGGRQDPRDHRAVPAFAASPGRW